MSTELKYSNWRPAAGSTGRRNAAGPPAGTHLSLSEATVQPSQPQRGSDPYNTSGSFDRKNNWARVGKR